MANQIQLFCSVQQFYREMGVILHQSNEKWKKLFNWRNLFFLFLLQLFGIAVLTFMLFNKMSFMDFGVSFYAYQSIIASTANIPALLWQSSNISEFIDDLGEFIRKSECKYN